MVKVFGMEGATAATNLAEGLPTYEKLIAQIDNVGTAAKMAEQNGANLVGAYQRLQYPVVVMCFLQALFGQNCKIFLDIVAKRFWTLLHVQIGQSCNAPAGCVINQP